MANWISPKQKKNGYKKCAVCIAKNTKAMEAANKQSAAAALAAAIPCSLCKNNIVGLSQKQREHISFQNLEQKSYSKDLNKNFRLWITDFQLAYRHV